MNYNPKSDKTFPSKIASIEQIDTINALKDKIVSNDNLEIVDIKIGNNLHSYILRLVTNYRHLATFLKLNFQQCSQCDSPAGKIYFINTNITSNLEDYRYYIGKTNEVVALDNDFYGNLKIAYRGLAANIALTQNLISLHSAAIEVNNRTVVITGVSGAGKSTIFRHCMQKLQGNFIWDDWGFINSSNKNIIIPNEIYNHLKVSSLSSLLPSFDNFHKSHTEFYDKNSAFFDSARIMINLRNHIPFFSNTHDNLQLHTIVILTNETNQGHFIKKINSERAKKIFFKQLYSKAYVEKVHFFNGALFINNALKKRYNTSYSMLFDNLKNIIQINNNYTKINYGKFEKLI